jgi:Tol biopolymer transport system component
LAKLMPGRSALPADAVNYTGLTFSPDGNYIYFVRSNKTNLLYSDLFQMPVLGGTPRPLIHNVDAPVSFSPDGRQFAFVRGVPDKNLAHLLVAQADGSGERLLASMQAVIAQGYFFGPACSPDGKTIAIATTEVAGGIRGVVSAIRVSDRERDVIYESPNAVGQVRWLADGSGLLAAVADPSQGFRGQLWHITFPGAEARRFTNDLMDYQLASLDLTRDRRTLVTIESRTSADLWVAPSGDASSARQITAGGPAVSSLSWLPDGRIVYGNSNGELFALRPDGSNRTVLAPGQSNNYLPTACGDGPYIVFQAYRNEKVNLWRMNADGSSLVQLTDEGFAAVPSCSPDGKWILHIVSGDQSLWRIPVDGGTPTQLNIHDRNSPRSRVSPDGKLVAYMAWGAAPSSPNVLTVAPFDGGPPLYKFDLPAGAGGFGWAPAEKALDYFLTRGGISNIYRQPLGGGQPRQITNFQSGQIFSFDWSHDGKQLAVARGTTSQDAILMKDFDWRGLTLKALSGT